MCRDPYRDAAAVLLAGAAGLAWNMGGTSLLGPAASILLPAAAALACTHRGRFAAALAYYLIGSVSIVDAVTGYHGAEAAAFGLLAWIGASVALAGPWTVANRPLGVLFALLATALPPLGVIGWLSPFNAAGAWVPVAGIPFIGIGFVLYVALGFSARSMPLRQTAICAFGCALVVAVVDVSVPAQPYGEDLHNLLPPLQQPRQMVSPPGWVGISTSIAPSRGNFVVGAAVHQQLIDAALRAGQGAQVLVFPEAILDDWLPGTRQQLANAVPPGQTWLFGAQVGGHDGTTNAVVAVRAGRAEIQPLANAAGLLLGGNWQPWSSESLRPAWRQSIFVVHGRRVWAALCVEQVQPWTWFEAMLQSPDVVLAMSNDWWARPDGIAPRIQVASTRSWARLMGVPVVWAINR